MKKLFLLLFTLTLCFQVNAQDNNAESSLGISFTPSTLSKGYDWGIGLVASHDFSDTGLGFGYMVQVTYLQPSDAISSVIDYGYSSDLLAKYDIAITDGLEFGPTVGGGYFAIQSDQGNDAEFYFAAGGTASYFITNGILLGVEVTKPFLEGAEISAAFSLRFQI